MLNIHVNTLLDFLNFFWPTVDLPTCKESLLGERRARLGHVHGIGRIGLRLVASEKIGPTSRNGKPLEWRSCPRLPYVCHVFVTGVTQSE